MVVFLDANILFSAAQQGSPSRQFVEILARHTSLITHPGVWEEAQRNLRAKRPQWMEGFASLSQLVALQNRISDCPEVGLPPKDQPVLGAAIGARADWLVTGDRTHFGPLFGKTLECVRVVSPQLMVEEMKTRGRLPVSE